jgi:hypothetical protein
MLNHAVLCCAVLCYAVNHVVRLRDLFRSKDHFFKSHPKYNVPELARPEDASWPARRAIWLLSAFS